MLGHNARWLVRFVSWGALLMAAGAVPDVSSPNWHWFVVGRWQEYAGEARANLIRVVAVGAFYILELVNYYAIGQQSPEYVAFHRTATAIAVAWTLLALGVLLCLRQQIFPPALKFISTAADIVLLTCLALAVEGVTGGPASPLVFIYFLIIALAGLRFSLSLVWMATLGSMLAYVALVATFDLREHGQWFDADHAVPPIEQLMVLMSLALVGVIVGQIVRRVRVMAEEFNERMQQSQQA
jgi:hypothetical protein